MSITVPTPEPRLIDSGTTSPTSKRSRPVVLVGALLLAILLVLAWGAVRDVAAAESEPAPTSAQRSGTNRQPDASGLASVAAVGVNQCNGIQNVGGQAVRCTVTVTNNLDLSTGLASSTTELVACTGFANAALDCVTTITPSNQLVTSVTQCDGSGNGGGGTVTCSVIIVNNITGLAMTSPATVNQCNQAGTGGGTEPTVVCDPFPANTTNATVTQCNDSGTGGAAPCGSGARSCLPPRPPRCPSPSTSASGPATAVAAS